MKYPHKGKKLAIAQIAEAEGMNLSTLKTRKSSRPEFSYSQCATMTKYEFQRRGSNVKVFHCKGRAWTYQQMVDLLGVTITTVRGRVSKIGVERTLNGEVWADTNKKTSNPKWDNPLPELDQHHQQRALFTSLVFLGFRGEDLADELQKRIAA